MPCGNDKTFEIDFLHRYTNVISSINHKEGKGKERNSSSAFCRLKILWFRDNISLRWQCDRGEAARGAFVVTLENFLNTTWQPPSCAESGASRELADGSGTLLISSPFLRCLCLSSLFSLSCRLSSFPFLSFPSLSIDLSLFPHFSLSLSKILEFSHNIHLFHFSLPSRILFLFLPYFPQQISCTKDNAEDDLEAQLIPQDRICCLQGPSFPRLPPQRALRPLSPRHYDAALMMALGAISTKHATGWHVGPCHVHKSPSFTAVLRISGLEQYQGKALAHSVSNNYIAYGIIIWDLLFVAAG